MQIIIIEKILEKINVEFIKDGKNFIISNGCLKTVIGYEDFPEIFFDEIYGLYVEVKKKKDLCEVIISIVDFIKYKIKLLNKYENELNKIIGDE